MTNRRMCAVRGDPRRANGVEIRMRIRLDVGRAGRGVMAVLLVLLAGSVVPAVAQVPVQRPVEELRSRIGLVLQDVVLFSQDVQYNIRLGSPDIPDERIRQAAERVLS